MTRLKMAKKKKKKYFCEHNYKWINISDGTACLKSWIKIRISLSKYQSISKEYCGHHCLANISLSPISVQDHDTFSLLTSTVRSQNLSLSKTSNKGPWTLSMVLCWTCLCPLDRVYKAAVLQNLSVKYRPSREKCTGGFSCTFNYFSCRILPFSGLCSVLTVHLIFVNVFKVIFSAKIHCHLLFLLHI